MRIGNRIGWMAGAVVLLVGTGVGRAWEAKTPLVRSPLAVVDTVKADSLADRAGMKPGDRVVEINGQASPRLEDVLAYLFDWEKGRETVFRLQRGEENIPARVPQGDWECEFRADLSAEAVSRLAAVREALKTPETWTDGQKAWEALAGEAWQAGFLDAACWLGVELGKSLSAARHGKEAETVLKHWGQAAPAKSYWAFAAVLELGQASETEADFDNAAQSYARAENLARDNGQELRLAGVWGKVFNFEFDRDRLPEAKAAGEKALAVRERLVPDTLLASEGFHDMGMVTQQQGDLVGAKAFYLKALALKERLAPDSLILAATLNRLGVVAREQGDMAGARDYAQKTLAIQERLAPDGLLVAKTFMNLAVLDAYEGNLPLAKERVLKALAIRQRLAPNSRDVAHSLHNLAYVIMCEGDLPLAKKYYQESLALWERRAPGSLNLAFCLAAMSNMYRSQGDLASARECVTRALAIMERLAPKSLTIARALVDLSNIVKEQGDLAYAGELLTRAQALMESLAPDNLSLADCLNNLGMVARRQGDLPMAREYYLKALAIYERVTPGSLETAYALTNLGDLSFDHQDLASARDFYQKALTLVDKISPGSLDEAENVTNLGAVSSAQGDLVSARELYLKALAIRERLAPDSLVVAGSRNSLGNLLRKQGDLDAARAEFGKAIAIYERMSPGSRELADSLRSLALTERAAEKLPLGAELLARAVDALEAQRSRVGGESAKTSFSAVTGDFYTDLIAAYLATKRPPLALETLERSRARTMLEMVASRYIDLKGEIPEALLERQRELASQRQALSDKLAQAGPKTDSKEIEAWRAELLMLPQREDALAEEIRLASPRLAALEYPKPLDFAAMREALAPGELLVAFAVGEKESYLFTLKKARTKAPDQALRAIRLNLGRKELGDRVAAYRNIVSQPEAGAEEWKKTSRELFTLLLGPAAPEIAGCDRILLLPDGPLHLLPFATLIPKTPTGRGQARLDPSLPLGLQRPISIQVSMTVYAGLRSGPGPASSAKGLPWTGIGDPVYPGLGQSGEPGGEMARLRTRGFNLGPLPGSRQEIESIAHLFGAQARVHLGPEATREVVLSLPKDTRLVHFACHGLLDPDFPMNSALALSPSPGKSDDAEVARNNGLLQAWEIIQDLRLNSDCVVLSACETGVGKVFGGEGILGLTRAFLYAGARSVVVSLWPISDTSAARFMQAFYREILAGAPRDQALQRAQASLARQPEFAHPFHWAAFVLVGSGQ